MSVAIYVRVSTAQQIDNTSLDSQIELCKKKAFELGYFESNLRIYREEGASGEDIDIRPEMTRLREDVASGWISHVICTHPDRLSRDLTDKLIAVREFEKNGAEVVFTDVAKDKSNEGDLFFNILSAIANYELGLIRKRTVRGRERAVKEQGKIMPMRVAPFGYDKDEKGQLVINKKEAQYVQMIYGWYVFENLTLREIGERLYEAGVMPKRGESKNWSASSIGRILTSEIYIGNYYYNRRKTQKIKGETTKSGKPKKTIGMRGEEEWIHVSVPAIIDRQMYELAQKQKEKNTTNKQVGNQKYEFLLKTVLKCGRCGRTWEATTYSGRTDSETGGRKKYRCYRCPNHAPRRYGPEVAKCESQTLRAEILEDYIWNEVVELVSHPEKFVRYINEQAGSGIDEVRRRMEQLQEEMDARQREKEKIKTMFRREVISEEEMVEDLRRLNEESSRLSMQIHKYQTQLDAHFKEELTLEKIQSMVEFVRTKLENSQELTFDFKRHIIMSLFDEIFVTFEGDELVITSIGAFDKLTKARNAVAVAKDYDIGANSQPQEIRKHRRRQ
ncbi:MULTISPECIES: recombinase family protein [Brevibacillus]|uniref:recombinase family protein n=1 Tax=Brevibacillus TaxID=55080 RepID=UPI000EE8B144|nr:recombinase family protein [Brevibacillus sp.]HBZ82491.1 recombinase family protein [Brevibacillus sp.]